MTKTVFKGAIAALLTLAPIAHAQEKSAGQTRQVLAERVCEDGSSTIVIWNGEHVIVEYFSAPHPNGTVSGYEDVYDRKNAKEAKAQFDALACPEG